MIARWRNRGPAAPPPPPQAALDPALAAWPFNRDSPVIQGRVQDDRPLTIMLVDLSGLDWPEIEPLLTVADEVSQAQGMVPVLVVDLVDPTPLHKAGFAYDMLPCAAANAALSVGLDWPAYLARRRAILSEKWRPGAIVHLGARSEW